MNAAISSIRYCKENIFTPYRLSWKKEFSGNVIFHAIAFVLVALLYCGTHYYYYMSPSVHILLMIDIGLLAFRFFRP